MIPRMGEVRSWHFAHRGDEDHCGTETYLHKLAKRLVKDKFERKGQAFQDGWIRKIYEMFVIANNYFYFCAR